MEIQLFITLNYFLITNKSNLLKNIFSYKTISQRDEIISQRDEQISQRDKEKFELSFKESGYEIQIVESFVNLLNKKIKKI